MSIEHRIDTQRRVVHARVLGVMTDADVFAYQRTVWSDPAVAGFDEIVDMSGVTEIVMPSSLRARDLAEVSAGMDAPDTSSRLAIVAPADFAFGLARMYASYRGLQERGSKEVEVFRSLEEATRWLEVPQAR
jgi:hypothetical protein